MQLHNPESPEPAECGASIWELIPWYVNGSLPAEQADTVRFHAQSCPICAAEIERQRRLATGVVKVDPFDVPLSRSWKSLRAQIKAEDRARSSQSGGRGRFAGLQGGFIALLGTVAVACLVIVVMPVNNSFETLTSQTEATTQIIKFQLASDIDDAGLERLLSEFGATLVTGPSELGIYIISVPDDADVQAVADAMMATSEILFAAPEVTP